MQYGGRPQRNIWYLWAGVTKEDLMKGKSEIIQNKVAKTVDKEWREEIEKKKTLWL